MLLALCWILAAPQGVELHASAKGRCQISQGAARLELPTDCANLSRSTMMPFIALDWRRGAEIERLLVQRQGDRLRVVLRRMVRTESLPVEESGDTILSEATLRAGLPVNGWPVIIETRTSRARQFNRVDRKADDVEVEETRFVYLLGAYRAVPVE